MASHGVNGVNGNTRQFPVDSVDSV
jgi:hypothetical protein